MTDFSAYDDQVLKRLIALQYGDTKRILLFTQIPIGLGGQIAVRLVGLRLALLFDRKVIFSHLDEPPYGQVFAPLHSSADFNQLKKIATNYFADGSKSEPVVMLDKWEMLEAPELQKLIYEYVPEGLPSICEPARYVDGLLLSFCHLIPKLKLMLSSAADRLCIGDDTLGVHVRRGDKNVETPYVPIDAINREIHRLCGERGFRRIFVSSDNDAVFDEIVVPPGTQLVFDKEERRYNNANHKFLLKSPQFSEQETATAVKNIFLLGRCGGIVGQSNAHFATLAAAQICFRKKGEFGALLQGDYVLRSSRVRRFSHSFKLGLRSAARRAFPWATLRGRTIRERTR